MDDDSKELDFSEEKWSIKTEEVEIKEEEIESDEGNLSEVVTFNNGNFTPEWQSLQVKNEVMDSSMKDDPLHIDDYEKEISDYDLKNIENSSMKKPSWTKDFGFILQKDQAVCALCCKTVICQTSSVKQHFETKHKRTFKDDMDKAKGIKRAVSHYEKQSSVFKSLSASRNQANDGSYKVAQCIAKHGKPFTDGDYIKEAFLSSSEVLFDGLPNKDAIISRIKDMPVSARTVERHILEMAAIVSKQQTVALKDATVFSVALNMRVDINDIPRLAIVARYSDTEVHEELCCLKPMYSTTQGKDVVKTFTDHFEERGVDIKKIFAVTTDGAPVMVEKHTGFAKLIEDKIGHPIMTLHCIIFQENFCVNSDLNDVMATVTKIMNFLVAHSALTHTQFRSLLDEMESAYWDIPLHCNVRWLSCGKVLERFVECFDEIKMFLTEKGQDYLKLEDEHWVVKLMFLTDITAHLNELNFRLQAVEQTVMDLYDTWKAVVAKLAVYSQDIQTATFHYFNHLKGLSAHHAVSVVDIGVYMQELESEFSVRFQDFQCFGPMFCFLIKPDNFEESDLDLSAFEWMEIGDFEMQLIDFKASSLWAAKFIELRKSLETTESDHGASILTCWASLPEKFDCLKKVAFALLSAFGSTYLCEQIFSHMKSILSPHHSQLTMDHSEVCVQLKVSRYGPEISMLSKGK